MNSPAACKRLAQGPHPDIDATSRDVMIFTYSTPGFSNHTETVSFVDEQQSFMAILNFDKSRQVRYVAIHAVDTFYADQRPTILMAKFGEHSIQGVDIIVGEPAPLCAG